MNNLEIYEMARAVPQEALKEIKAGRLKGMSDINPMWRIKRLTEIFGPCGIGWWYDITDKRLENDETTMQTAAFVDILLYYRWNGEVSHGIPGTGGSTFVAQERNGAYMSDECFKMALTDAISVAAKAIGIGADVYYAKDKTKYTNPNGDDLPFKDEPKAPVAEVPEERCERCARVILPYKNPKGQTVSVAQHIAASKRKCNGMQLCLDCATEYFELKQNAAAV